MPRKKKKSGLARHSVHSRGRQRGIIKAREPFPTTEANTTEDATKANKDEDPFPTLDSAEAPTTEEQRLQAFFLEQDSEVQKQPAIDQRARRLAVAYLFVMVHGAPEEEKDWKGQANIGPKIKKALGMSLHTKIYPILRDVLACKKEGVTYRGERSVEKLLGRPCTIALDSVEAQIIADSTEDGFGREHTKLQVNQYRKEQNLPSLTTAAVSTCIKNLQPKVHRIGVKSQGSKDPNSAWCNA
jgi:hypothetical protein